jgi:hypothetical protein
LDRLAWTRPCLDRLVLLGLQVRRVRHLRWLDLRVRQALLGLLGLLGLPVRLVLRAG